MSDGPDFNKIMTLLMVVEKAGGLPNLKSIRDEAFVELNKTADELVKVQEERRKKEQEEAAQKAAEEAKAKAAPEAEKEGDGVTRRF